MRRCGFVCLFCFACIAFIHSQSTEKSKSFGGFPFLSLDYIEDETFSKVARKGSSLGLNLFYQVDREKNLSLTIAQFNSTNVQPFTNEINNATFYQGSLSHLILKKISANRSKFDFYVGGELQFDFEVLIPERVLRYAWDVTLMIHPTWLLEYDLNTKTKLRYRGNVGLVGLLWRPAFQGFTLQTEEILETQGLVPALLEHPRIGSLSNTFKTMHQFMIFQQLSNNIDFIFCYQVDYKRVRIPRVKRSLGSQLGLGLNIKL